ncbi:MAG: hypothetical protein EP338_04535 [Bacteroidetes bacterium]|nr:MAG: hypothetical protein EP338_04535 [Bacteroidota bacterium]
MLGRFFLLVLSILSLGWISFVAYDLLDKKEFISPERVFGPQDGEILIVNRSQEVHLDELDFKMHESVRELYEVLLKKVYRNEQLYATEKSPVILVRQGGLWDQTSVSDYFKTKGIDFKWKEGRAFQLKNGFQGRYKRNYLVIHPRNMEVEAHEPVNWPVWDYKASASIIRLDRPLRSTNVYFKKNGTVSYETKYGEDRRCPKMDDADLFAQQVPGGVKSYYFVEKNFAEFEKQIPVESPLKEWMESGYVIFKAKGKKHLICDYNKAIDPVQLLLAEHGDSLGRVRQLRLTKDFPSSLEQGFYVAYLADKLLFSEDKYSQAQVQADYEAGNTLALDREKMDAYYGKLPSHVSSRVIDEKEKYSVTAFKGLLIRTDLQHRKETILRSDKQMKKQHVSFGIDGELLHLLDDGEQVYAVTSKNWLLAFANQKQIWKYQLDGPCLERPRIVDIYQNGNKQILLNTAGKVHLITAKGLTANEYPLKCASKSPVTTYRWAGQTYMVLVDLKDRLVLADAQGRVIKKVRLRTGPVSQGVRVYRKEKRLVAEINGQDHLERIDLDKSRVLEVLDPLGSVNEVMKTSTGFDYYRLREEKLYRVNEKEQVELAGLGKVSRLKRHWNGVDNYLIAMSENKIWFLYSDGSRKVIETGLSGIDDVAVFQTTDGRELLAVLDGIENNVYLFDMNGQKQQERSLEGLKAVSLSRSGGNLVITSSLHGSIVQYNLEGHE